MSTNKVTNAGVSASREVDTLLIEKFTGRVKEAYVKQENLMRFFDVQRVEGTNTVSEKFMGETQLQVLSAGKAPEATTTDFDKNALVVDTAVISRNAEALIHNIQSDIESTHSKLAANQTSQLSRLEDEMLVQQCIYGAQLNTKANRTKPRVTGHGFSQQISINAAQAGDPDAFIGALELALERLLTGHDGEGDGIDLQGLYIMLPWSQFNILRDAERIVNGDYNTFQGDTVSGFTLKSYNVPVIPSNRFPRLVNGKVISRTHLLSTENSNRRYTANEDQANAKAIIFSGDALLVGVTLNLESDIWWDKNSKSYIIDSWQSEGAIPSIWEAVAVVDTVGNTENAEVKARASRKVAKIKSVT